MKPLLGFVELLVLVQLLLTGTGHVHGMHDFYERLSNGNDKYDFLKLETPIHFFSDKYDDLYINTNGIVTFGLPFANFTNAPFPLEVPAIAPFYANVDTSSNNPQSSIVYYKTKDEDTLFRETSSIRSSFYEATDFEAVEIVGAKWENVGHFRSNDEKLNSFEVVIICGAEETYVKFVYPRNGLNWVRGDTGESGLPDIRAQAGFVSEDGRHFVLQGSGTDKVKYLSESTNYDEVGSWLFRVGPFSYEDDVAQPDQRPPISPEPRSCSTGGSQRCHINAECHDTSLGFCCQCRKYFIGNGLNCIKGDAPLRITGTVTGTIGSEAITSQLQSYVVLTDGRSYTAISPVSSTLGVKMQFLQSVGGTIGWLFSKTTDNVYKNGYQITGGKFNHSITLRFENTGEQFYINQRYLGLNLYDQLSAEIELSGDLPDIPLGTRLQINDFKEEYLYSSPDKITVVASRHSAKLGNQDNEIVFSVYQEISFDSCPYVDNPSEPNSLAGSVKTSKITLSYESRENALRIGMLSKVGPTHKQNPCNDGSSNCGDNTICVPTGEDTYECNCKNGYTYVPPDGSGIEHCVDINECRGVNICDTNADCINEQGGYSCRCRAGFEGNGYTCSEEGQTTNEADDSYDSRSSHSSYPTQNPDYYPDSYSRENERYRTTDSTEESGTSSSNPCDLCSPNAYCEYETCVCHSGFHGNGHECRPQCGRDFEWDGDSCKPLTTAEEYEIRPFCNQYGCECSTGYRLIEYAIGQMCRLVDPDSDAMEDESVACDIANNCNPFANCEFSDEANKYICVCEVGYDGNGYDCTEKEISCVEDKEVCDEHASCIYSDAYRKSVCICDAGYEGDGKFCQLAPECSNDDDCGHHSMCDEGGTCVCQSGYERDISDLCVQAGSCGGAYCAENAICKWDPRQKVSYCHCPEGLVGDGINSCKSLPPPCNVRNNCGLYASCVPNYRDPSMYECACKPGFFGDGFVCTPERNCANVPELCDHNAQCLSTTAGYECVCNQGFIGNGSVCATAPRLESGFLFISQGVATVRIPFDGSRGRPIAMAQMAIGLDKDCSEGRIYWSDISTKTIQSSKYDGSDKKPFITEDIASPEGLAVDWISRRLYWTDSSKDTIEVASLDDPKLRTVIVNKHLVNPRGIAVDPHRNKLFWSDWNRESPKIEWSNLDGTDRQVLLAHPKVELPNSLDISLQTGELCFADAGTHKIECIDTYTKDLHTIASNLSYPFGLALSSDRFFWTDWTTKKIESVDFEGNRQKSIPTPLFGSHKMYGMTAITDRCPVFFSPCHYDNGHCSPGTICLASPRAQSGRVCKCAIDCDNVINVD